MSAERRVGVRLSRAQDVVGCVAVPGHSPADSWLGCFLYIAATSRTYYSAAYGVLRPPMVARERRLCRQVARPTVILVMERRFSAPASWPSPSWPQRHAILPLISWLRSGREDRV
jgi:hypothetical protein